MSDRRSFLKSIAAGIGLFTILPPATTYSRIWKAVIVQEPNQFNPDDYSRKLVFVYLTIPKRFVYDKYKQMFVPIMDSTGTLYKWPISIGAEHKPII